MSLSQVKEKLGDDAGKYTDEELAQARDDLYILAEIAFERWRKEKIDKKSYATKRSN